jgi:hypothetical protein
MQYQSDMRLHLVEKKKNSSSSNNKNKLALSLQEGVTVTSNIIVHKPKI